jgi:PKD repeat protein
MKKLLLFLQFLAVGLFSTAQQSHKDHRLNHYLQDGPVVLQNSNNHVSTSRAGGGSRAGLPMILNSQRIGSAGNVLTIINNTTNQMDVDSTLNTVTFIHRNDPSVAPGTNVAQYRFDVSKDGGTTWTSNIGPITNDASIDNVSVNGRFPQALIYNPAGNTVADSAYLVYSGTWHDGTTWSGEMRGRGKLSGDTATFNVKIDPINNKHVAIAGGLCQSVPGTFWNVNLAYTGTFNGGNAITSAVIVEKGVWDSLTNDITWTQTNLNQAFVATDNNGSQVSIATSQNIAFDPTGQYGWIVVLGDIVADNDSTYEPIFWKTTDGGQNWTGPIHVQLEDIQGVLAEMNPTIVNGDPASMKPTTAFDADLTVDANGNPHLLVVVGSGDEYSIQAAGYDVWDITYDANAVAGCKWKGIHLADIMTLRGSFTSDATPYTEDNRPLVSRSADGNKIFFFWNESDFTFLQSTDNDVPNLFGRAIDVAQGKMTPLYNFTEGDSLWGGETSNTSGGVFGGSIFPMVSQTAWKKGNNWNVPTVFTQIDYNNDPSQGLGSGDQPAAFWYVSNINFPAADFNSPLDNIPPTITLNGQDTVTVLINTPYTEAGATAFDCTDGVIIPVVQNAPDTSVVGVYNVLYIATDAAGNSDTVVRVVIVGATPVADFTWSFPQLSYKAQFTDQSTNLPTSWVWQFGDGGGSVAQNPVKTYTANNVYNVCLTAKNSFGTSAQVCKQVSITGVGIDEPEFSQHLSMFPNPTNGKVTIKVDGNVSTDMTVTVYNILGEVVKEPTFYKAGTTQMEINMQNVVNGLYLVKIQSPNGTAVKQLTVNHK